MRHRKLKPPVLKRNWKLAKSVVSAEAVEPVAAPAPVPAPAPAPVVETDAAGLLVAHLRELAELHRDGLLDDYEFAMAKAKLLR